jgi:hypothetical protein
LAKTAARGGAVIEVGLLAAWRPWEVASSVGGYRLLAARWVLSAAVFDEQQGDVVVELPSDVAYRPVETDGAARTAKLIAQLV